MSLNRIMSDRNPEPPVEFAASPPTPPASVSISMTAPTPQIGSEVNTVRRVNRAGGLFGLFKTAQHNIKDQVNDLNRTGYRVTFVISDSWTPFQTLGAILLLICTLGIYSKAPGFLIIGERIS